MSLEKGQNQTDKPQIQTDKPQNQPDKTNEKAIIVFVKNPDPGAVKTRLAADIGPEMAMDTYLRMVTWTMDQVRAADAHVHVFFSREVPDTWPVFNDFGGNAAALADTALTGKSALTGDTAVSGDTAVTGKSAVNVKTGIAKNTDETGVTEKDFATKLFKQGTSSLSLFQGTTGHVQQGNDLGERMNNAFLKLFRQHYSRIIIIGSDCPGLRTHHLEEALDALKSHDAVIGPAKDGGYYLLGTGTHRPYLFQNKKWSTSSVFRETEGDLTQRGALVYRLPVLQDLDTRTDLQELKSLIIR